MSDMPGYTKPPFRGLTYWWIYFTIWCRCTFHNPFDKES